MPWSVEFADSSTQIHEGMDGGRKHNHSSGNPLKPKVYRDRRSITTTKLLCSIPISLEPAHSHPNLNNEKAVYHKSSIKTQTQ
jgi:hypothetical protein